MNTTVKESNVRVFASPRSWIEEEALRQLYASSRLEGVRLVVGFPDLNSGKGSPVGAAVVTSGVIYPHLVGDDVGCGVGLFRTNLLLSDLKLTRWVQMPFDLEHPWRYDATEVCAEFGLGSTERDGALGTLGNGNHFVELQSVEEVLDVRELRRLEVGKQQLVVLVHSGSGGLGKLATSDYAGQDPVDGLETDSLVAGAYLQDHNLAVRWAKVNRAILAERFVKALGAEAEFLCDACHNGVSAHEHEGETLWVHRKGAMTAENEAVVIPGSRGALSYLVKPLEYGESRAWSLAHGAGRKWARSEARLRMRERFRRESLTHTWLGGRVICGDRSLLYEQAPAAYKDIEAVIADLVDAGLARVIATLRPLLTYKCKMPSA